MNLASTRVVSGMRPTGRLHLGHYHGVLKNWLRLQAEHACFFFVADWHALTTHYAEPPDLQSYTLEMVSDWLAAGVDPERACVFIQSQVPEHAELHLLLSMLTPLGWLERVPSYKDQQEKLRDKDLATYGFLGYPLLQSADILIYRAGLVPVGEDQVAHVELTREVARRFNHLYGRRGAFTQLLAAAHAKLGAKNVRQLATWQRQHAQQGDAQALVRAQQLLALASLSPAEHETCLGDWHQGGRQVLPEPQPLLTPAAKVPGLDGQKMSKSYNNTLSLREEPKQIEKKLRAMPTDPARVRRTDPGDPERCPVWRFHQVYSDPATRDWVATGCRSAGIGCLDCKQPVINAITQELAPMQARAAALDAQPQRLREIIAAGSTQARTEAQATLAEVRAVIGLTAG